MFGPKMKKLLSTSLSTLLDEYWNTTLDSKTGMTQRQQACDGDKGIKRQVQDAVHKSDASYNAYDISCNLATTGKVLVQQSGSVLYLSYQSDTPSKAGGLMSVTAPRADVLAKG
ncbi:MAG: hypothetical protein C4288_19285, partial [Leptolyngbya sp. ERB_1_1]